MSDGTEYYSDMDILKLIEERLKYGNEYFYNKEIGNYGDIYGTEIEIPLMITDILILTENKIKWKLWGYLWNRNRNSSYDNRYFNSYRK